MSITADPSRTLVVPLGGVGTGQVGLAADGSLTQWQIHGQVNHRAEVPETVFGIRAAAIEPPRSVRRILRGAPRPGTHGEDPPLVTDHAAARWPASPVDWAPVETTTLDVSYPFATVRYEDHGLELSVSMEAHSPFVPLDPDASAMPLICYRFRVHNPTQVRYHGWVVGTLLNTVGWDGVTPIEGPGCPLFGGNVNRVVRRPDQTAVLMDDAALREDDPAYGSMCLWTDAPAHVLPRARHAADVFRWVDSLKLLESTILDRWDDATLRRAIADMAPTMRDPVGPSPAGRTWLGGLALAFSVAPGETADLSLVHAWWFPNRVVDFDQFGPGQRSMRGAWLGNAYAEPWSGALDVVDAWLARRTELEARSRDWARSMEQLTSDGGLDAAVARTLEIQPALIRTPSMFVAADGTLFGYEGSLGASTLNWNGDVGGSCPLNCSHVWNYEQTVAALFPSLERTMRVAEWESAQARDGSLPHRLRVPLDGPQLHGVPIGGPLESAVDGMLGSVLKTWREARNMGDPAWLARLWPRVERLMDHVSDRWAGPDGVLRGPQPVTFDIALTGANMYTGSLWIAALRAMEAAADTLGEAGLARGYGARAADVAGRYDQLLWNGAYYAQTETDADHDFGAGCLSDQLFGQWWAHLLGLGHILPEAHVRAALSSVVHHNLRTDHVGAEHGSRVFAIGSEGGLAVCTWPRGGRPRIPVRYADEVWSGTEYQVAAACLFEGLGELGLRVLRTARQRIDGSRRNPFNEIECGDHYVRAMAGWSLLPAATGSDWDGFRRTLRLRRATGSRPFLTGDAWGTATWHDDTLRLTVHGGTLRLDRLAIIDAQAGHASRPIVSHDLRATLAPGAHMDLAIGQQATDRPATTLPASASAIAPSGSH